jgi:hypothetical protein
MSDNYTALEIERNDLYQKICNLEDHLYSDDFDKLDAHNKSLLEIQLTAMETYLCILNNRITLIERF